MQKQKKNPISLPKTPPESRFSGRSPTKFRRRFRPTQNHFFLPFWISFFVPFDFSTRSKHKATETFELNRLNHPYPSALFHLEAINGDSRKLNPMTELIAQI
jgi:hypothetical protein